MEEEELEGGNERRFQVCQEVEESERQIVQVSQFGPSKETRKARRQDESSRSSYRCQVQGWLELLPGRGVVEVDMTSPCCPPQLPMLSMS